MRIRHSLLEHKLYRNFKLMFWVQALIEVKVINVISTLFYLYRGLSLTQIFYTAIIFSVVSLLSEVPSSYLADKWGRKKVIISAVLVSLIYWVVNIFAWSFPIFVLAISLYAFANALISGTDEALIYDTSKQLKIENFSLKHLGNYYSARRIFKMIVPLLAVLIAHNLTNFQYIFVLSIDVVTTSIAVIISFFLTEPHHSMEVEQIEAGVLKDALKLFRQNTNLLRIMFNKSLVFIAVFMFWRINSEYFTSRGVSLFYLGVATSTYQFIIYGINRHIVKLLPRLVIEKRINIINLFVAILLTTFFIFNFIGAPNILLLIIFVFSLTAEMIRWPLFSEIINKVSSSYNRATTLSLANFLKSILDIPLLFFAAYLVNLGYSYLFALMVILAFIPVLLFPLKHD